MRDLERPADLPAVFVLAAHQATFVPPEVPLVPQCSRATPYTRDDARMLIALAIAKFALHMIFSTRYGYFGDELYFLACSEHLDWGYVDLPPFFILLVWFMRLIFGASLMAIHLLPALAGAVKVYMAGVIARELGGGRFAQFLAALTAIIAPVYLAVDHLLSMNCLEPVIWMGCALIVIRIIKTGNQKLWLWFGVLAGIGLETKYSMGVFGLAVFVALLLTTERRAFAEKWIWIAGGIAFLIFLPNLLWNVAHHWPFVELMHNINASGRDVKLPPLAFFVQQMMMMNPFTLPIWLTGIIYLFAARDMKPYRALGWMFAITFLFFMVTRAKDYYSAPAYPIAIAAGAIAIERAIAWSRHAWIKPVAAVLLVASTVPLVPLTIPVLPPDTTIRYIQSLPFKLQASEQSHRAALLPHHFAWRSGWPEMVAATARVYQSLSPEEQKRTAIFGNNYAEAGAIDLLGAKYGLPKAIGGHQNYFLWGPRDYHGETVIVLGDTVEGASKWFREVRVGAELNTPYARPVENRPVLLCRGLKVDLREAWPKVKAWD
jgi:hypothetical protein